MNLKELLKLAGKQGKVVVVGDDGEVKGVFVTYAEYQKNHQHDVNDSAEDPEKVNRQILEAQLKDNMDLTPQNIETIPEVPMKKPESIGQILQERASNLFVSKPAPPTMDEINYDPREESEHPAMQRTASPTISIADDEEIKPSFEDI